MAVINNIASTTEHIGGRSVLLKQFNETGNVNYSNQYNININHCEDEHVKRRTAKYA